jgi:hypothetical protein
MKHVIPATSAGYVKLKEDELKAERDVEWILKLILYDK